MQLDMLPPIEVECKRSAYHLGFLFILKFLMQLSQARLSPTVMVDIRRRHDR